MIDWFSSKFPKTVTSKSLLAQNELNMFKMEQQFLNME